MVGKILGQTVEFTGGEPLGLVDGYTLRLEDAKAVGLRVRSTDGQTDCPACPTVGRTDGVAAWVTLGVTVG